jgi:hypothetical protein
MRLSIITLGDVHAEDLAPLAEQFTHLEQLVLDVHPRDPLARHHPELNRALEASSGEWILIVRERERVDAALAKEIAGALQSGKRFRIRTRVIYAGKPLQIPMGEGEVRLFSRMQNERIGEESVQAELPVLHNPLRAITFASVAEHRAYLEKNYAPHSTVRRALLFLRDAIGLRTLDANTLRYIWTEAGFDKP